MAHPAETEKVLLARERAMTREEDVSALLRARTDIRKRMRSLIDDERDAPADEVVREIKDQLNAGLSVPRCLRLLPKSVARPWRRRHESAPLASLHREGRTARGYG